MKKNFGTPEQFKDAVENKIIELGGTIDEAVESATNTANIGVEPVASANDDNYFSELKKKVSAAVKDFMNDFSWEQRKDFVTVSVPDKEQVHVVDIPFKDLSKSVDTIDDDVDYIVGYLKQEFGNTKDDTIESAYDWNGIDVHESNYDDWEEVAHKTVPDADGFLTDYTMYKKKDEDLWICMFGDPDLYPPDEDYADWTADSAESAWEWFDSYTGFDEDEDESLLDDSWEG